MRLTLTFVVSLLVACSGQHGTALWVTVTQPPGLQIDQLRAQVESAPSELWGPVLAPETPSTPLRGTQTLRLLLPDALGDSEVSVDIEGLALGQIKALGDSRVKLSRGAEVTVEVALAEWIEPVTDGGFDAGQVELDGSVGHLDAGQPMLDAGQPEFDAGHPVHDAGQPVHDAGQPVFDAGQPVPDAGQSVPDAGQPVFDAGQPVRDAGQPVRDAGQPVRDAGQPVPDAGSPCARCNSNWSDGCSMLNQCTCGAGLACNPGQRCLNGLCVCNPSTCGNGCCLGNVCTGGTTRLACGIGGQSCDTCKANRECANGKCVKDKD